jgi:hypothetical protein
LLLPIQGMYGIYICRYVYIDVVLLVEQFKPSRFVQNLTTSYCNNTSILILGTVVSHAAVD